MDLERAEQLTTVVLLAKWVATSKRQLVRADEAACRYHALAWPRDRDPGEDIDDVAVIEAGEDLSDQVYFLVLAAHHGVVNAPDRVRHTHTSPPKAQTRLPVETLRNVLEHWYQPRQLAIVVGRGLLKPWAARGSGRFFAQTFPDGSPFMTTFGSEGLTNIGGALEIADLRSDLDALAAWAAEQLS